MKSIQHANAETFFTIASVAPVRRGTRQTCKDCARLATKLVTIWRVSLFLCEECFAMAKPNESLPIRLLHNRGGIHSLRPLLTDRAARRAARNLADQLEGGRDTGGALPYIVQPDGTLEHDATRENIWITGKNYGTPDPSIRVLTESELEAQLAEQDARLPRDAPWRITQVKGLELGNGYAFVATLERFKRKQWLRVGEIRNRGNGGPDEHDIPDSTDASLWDAYALSLYPELTLEQATEALGHALLARHDQPAP